MQDHANSGETVRLTDLTYEDWLEHAFGHEVRIHQAAWFFDQDRDCTNNEAAASTQRTRASDRHRGRVEPPVVTGSAGAHQVVPAQFGCPNTSVTRVPGPRTTA